MIFPNPVTTLIKYDDGETLYLNITTVKYAKYDPLLEQTRIVFNDGEEIKVNGNILERLKDGSTLTITHSVEGTRSGICTSLVPTPMKGGVFVMFSMTVVEQ